MNDEDDGRKKTTLTIPIKLIEKNCSLVHPVDVVEQSWVFIGI